MAEVIAQKQVMDRDVIHSVTRAYSPTGGLAILFGAPGLFVVYEVTRWARNRRARGGESG